jgi:hypothetical protein
MHEMSLVVHNSVVFREESGENTHMGIMGKALKAAERICRSVETIFGSGTTRTTEKVRLEILESVKSSIATDTSGNRFSYAKLIVWLQPPTEALRNGFEAALLKRNALKKGILELLSGAKPGLAEPFEVMVELRRDMIPGSEISPPRPLFQLDFVKQDPSIGKKLPEAKLVISKGSGTQSSYQLKKERILIGRSQEVLDREGHMIRRNDVVFLDNEDEINATVDPAHARIWFDFEKDQFFIMDEVSSFGTIIMREGRSVEVPAGNTRGIHLRSGDAVYCGQACLHFEEIK